VAYSHNLLEDGKYVLLNKEGRARLLCLGEGLQESGPYYGKTHLAPSPTCSIHRVIGKYTNNVA
jgi:hypothetical protein